MKKLLIFILLLPVISFAQTTAEELDITVEQGSNWYYDIIWTDIDGDTVDITGMTVRMQIRLTKDSETKIVDMASGSGWGITIPDSSSGTITVNILSDSTASWDIDTNGVYDLEYEDVSGRVIRLMKGDVIFDKEVTR